MTRPRITHRDPESIAPCFKRFTDLVWQVLACWICLVHPAVAIAVDDDDASPAKQAKQDSRELEPPIGPSEREHWSFRPLSQPVIPEFTTNASQQPSHSGQLSDQAANAIDRFLLARLSEQGLSLAPAAPPMDLLRRLTFDLTGLAPEPEAIERFTRNAHEPDAYLREVDRLLASPRCGEHLAQGWLDLARYAETDGFEHDKVRSDAWRYRDWVIQAINDDVPYDRFMQLQVAGDLTSDPDGPLATTFCLAGPDMPDINDQEERRHNLLNEMTGTVGSVFLGLQLGCAACHDHKYDPVSQADFYRLRGILQTGVGELTRDKPWNQLVEQKRPDAPRFYHRGDHRQATTKLAYALPRIVTSTERNHLVSISEKPRMQLAEWLADPTNPLPARVMANRIWQRHFGRGLAATPSDLGLVGLEPTHPELLDWLAIEFQAGQWSAKRLSRQIVLSAAYQSTSRPGDDSELSRNDFETRVNRDPDNHLLSRFPRRRMTGEMIRDAMLQSAGLMDHRMHGPSVMPPLAKELIDSLLPGQWKPSDDAADHARRSVYIFARRNLRYPIFETFDRPDAGASCPQRGRSVTATQSLMLLNSEFSLQMAEHIVDRTVDSVGTPDDLNALGRGLWLRTLGREPSAGELIELEKLVRSSPSFRIGVVSAALGLLNCNEFITLD